MIDGLKAVHPIIAIVASILTIIANFPKDARVNSPQQTYSQLVQQRYEAPRYYSPPPTCWWEPRREHVGRYITHVEEFWVPNRYGGWRLIQRAHYVDQYRTSHLQICS
jgi:hypothetical protein